MNSWSKVLNHIWIQLILLEIVLFSIFILLQFFSYVNLSFSENYFFKLFDFGLEVNIPTFVEGFLFIILSISAYFCGVFDKLKGVAKKKWLPWILISSLLLFLSLDEFVQIHEQFTDPTRELFGVGGFLYFSWVIPYLLALLLLLVYFAPFLLELSRKTRLLIFTGAIVFILGAVGFEMMGARLYEIGASDSIRYTIVSSLEELFEVTGILIAMRGLFNEVLARVSLNSSS